MFSQNSCVDTDGQQTQGKCSILLIIREMQIKTTRNITSRWSEWLSSKSLQTGKAAEGVGKKGAFLHCWRECKSVQPLWRMVWQFLKKLKSELPYVQKFHSWAYIWRKLSFKMICASIYHMCIHHSYIYE